MRTLSYSIVQLDLVPAKYLITAHIQNGGETESLKQYSAKSYAHSTKIVNLIATKEQIPTSLVQKATGLGLPTFQQGR